MSINLNNLNILVTGADGFIGSHLTEKLVQLGANVKALSFYNAFSKVGWLSDIDLNIKNNLEVLQGDIRDSEYVSSISKKIDIVFHLAALISIPYSYVAPRAFVDTNILGTLNMLEAIKKSDSARAIFTSTSEVYGSAQKVPITEDHILQAQSPYSASKISADHILDSYVRSFNLPALILRPFNTYGPRQSEKAVIPSIIRQALDSKIDTLKAGSLETKRDFNYVSDTVMAFILLATVKEELVKYGTAYNSGTGVAVSISEVLDIIYNLTNCNKKILHDKKRTRPEKSEVILLQASAEKLKAITDWEPKVDLNEGLKITIDWWRNRLLENKGRLDSNYTI